MPLIMVVGCLGRQDASLRAAAGAVLGALCARMGATPHTLLLHSLSMHPVLEYVGQQVEGGEEEGGGWGFIV